MVYEWKEDDGICPVCNEPTLKCNIGYHMHDHSCSTCGYQCGRNIPVSRIAQKEYTARHKRYIEQAKKDIADSRRLIKHCEERLYRWGVKPEGTN